MSREIGLRSGDRGVIVGKSGSGKTFLGLEIARHMPRPLVIVDTKYSASIKSFAEENGFPIVSTIKKAPDDVCIWRPTDIDLADPKLLDEGLQRLLDGKPCSVYIDELYQFHINGKAGPGLIGLYTRGREAGFCTLGGAQRPVWISLFCLTEANHFYIMRLDLPQDTKRMADVSGSPEVAEWVPNRWFWYIEEGDDPVLMHPLTIPEKSDSVADTEPSSSTGYYII